MNMANRVKLSAKLMACAAAVVVAGVAFADDKIGRAHV